MSVQTSATIVVNAPLERVFEISIAIEPSDLIRPYGPLPGVAKTEGHQGPWTAPGVIRHHTLTDHSSVDEELTKFEQDACFAYKISILTGAFSALIDEGRAEWRFEAAGPRQTRIVWNYTLAPKGPVVQPLVWLIVKLMWPGYLRAALKRVKEKAETGPHENCDLQRQLHQDSSTARA